MLLFAFSVQLFHLQLSCNCKTVLELQKPYLWSPNAEHMAILRGDDLSPTAMDAYELVKSFVPAEIPEVRPLLQGLAIPLAMFVGGCCPIYIGPASILPAVL